MENSCKEVVSLKKKNIVDEYLLDEMLSSETIEEWNSNRELAKRHRPMSWVSQHIDASGLIGKTKIAYKPCD